MATKNWVTIPYLCLELLIFVSFVFGATVFRDNIEYVVPNDAKSGHIVTKLGCSDTGITIRPEIGGQTDNQLFPGLFLIDKSGNLVVKSDLSLYDGFYFTVSVFSTENCFKNVEKVRTFGVVITSPQDHLDLGTQVFRGYVDGNSKPGDLVKGLENLVQSLRDPLLSCSLIGDSANLFDLLPSSNDVKILSNPLSVGESVYYSIQCMKGNAKTTNGLHISYKNQPTDSVFQSENSLIKSFDQISVGTEAETHRRHKRQSIDVRTLSVNENVNEILTLESPQQGALTWSITDSTDTFTVNNQGKVSVKPGKKLDYDYGRRNYDITVTVQEVLTVLKTYQVSITVKDVNDEIPKITNHPSPFQERVDPASATSGTRVYQLEGYDPDTNSSLRFLLDGLNDYFTIDPSRGWIAIKQQLSIDNVYTVRAYVQDMGAPTLQRSPTVEVLIYTRDLQPQFNETSYTAKVQETNQPSQTFDTYGPDGHVSLVKVKNFQAKLGGSTTITVMEGATASTKFRIDEAGHVVTMTSLDYETDPKTFDLKIVATDTKSSMSSSVNLTVNLQDSNEYDPTFTLSTYTARIAENLPVGSSVLPVTATDQDANSVLTFWVSEPLFSVRSLSDTVGELQVNGTLDYDRLTSHRYEFDIYVRDNGQPSKTSQAKVLIDVTNVNDEKPEFQTDNMVTTIKDSIQPGSDIYLVQAVDLDGDKIRYTFENNALQRDIFEIAADTGQIKIRQGSSIPSNVDVYNLPVWATDDGSCCGGGTSLTSTAIVTINIVDSVNTKPIFGQCSSYEPTVMENQAIGTPVITVSATDNNRGENGIVDYFAVSPGNQDVYFTINKTTGVVSTAKVLDRESFGSRYLFFTVRAVDRGTPPGDEYCTFRIVVGDDNDNRPEFGVSSYTGSIVRTASIGRVVMTVKATDKDIGQNAEIVYSKVTVSDYFDINNATGVITVIKSLSDAPSTSRFSIKATDKGTPSQSSDNVSIDITITENDDLSPPKWSTTTPQFSVNETAPQDHLVGSLTATSQIAGSSGVTFTAIANGNAGSQVPPFYIKQDDTNPNQVNIYILNRLNYEETKSYTFQLRARDNKAGVQVTSDVFPQIIILDQNDEIPFFRGRDPSTTFIEASVQENLSPGAVVTTLAAADEDINPQFKQLKYSLFGENSQNFTIDETTGVIRTASMFDRESIPGHYIVLKVRVNDGYPSARPGSVNDQPNSDTAQVRVKIGDVNDNPPVFDKPFYTANIREDAFISDIITTVEAKDLDEAVFQYSIVQGPGSAFFAIKTRELIGEIVVAGNLDYETGPNKYNLTVKVNDGNFTAETIVEVSIIDVNDNPPVFNPSSYEITDVTEEVSYSPANPRFLLTANATDPDTFRQKGMEYKIANDDPKISQLFQINPSTGVLNLVGKLDRDKPNGRDVYQFNIMAIDEPGEVTRLTGYATVQIKPIDINDNAPVFIPLNPSGSVKENSPIGESVMRVKAEDYDEGVNADFTFQIIGQGNPSDAFRIEPGTGDVFTTVNNLDREQYSQYTFVVKATDRGTPIQSSTATVTINLIDVNDNPPVFNQSVYKVTIPETHSGQILKIKAYDPDVDETLRYSLNKEAYAHFTIDTQGREGIIGVYNGSNPDYEAGETFFNLTATVMDRDNKYSATTNIQITITDVNDEKPIFKEENVEKSLLEGPQTPVGTVIANFTATDRDNGINGKIKYSISKLPFDQEPRKYFRLENHPSDADQQYTTVILLKELDRETIAKHTVFIHAMDSGEPQQTGTATLTVNVLDINDNYPRLRDDYATIKENVPAQTLVTTVYGDDPDSPENGPPYGFSEIQCQATDPNAAQCKFSLTFDPSLDGGNGGAVIRSKQVFDRELQKFYYLPIRMWDKRGGSGAGAMTGTNTLTIEIGDVNDNEHGPGTQNIHVYNYKGMFKNIPIGFVNYEDLDDHDIADKTFTFRGPPEMTKFFSVRQSDGMITMLHNVPTGTWRFQVDVYDSVDTKTTTSDVVVTIQEMPEEAPFKSGSVRLSGTTPEKFITPDSSGKSPYDKFRTRLATSLGTAVENVEMISVLKNGDYTDVRFSAHGSPYYSPTKMNSAVLRNSAGFQQDAGATIEMVNIDECLKENCEAGCYNYLNVTGKANLVSIRGTSVVGVETFVQGKCGCHEPVSQTDCDPTYCFNGGTCKKDFWNVLSCECSAGFDGPRCQSTRHGFDGTGYALYKPLEQCENSETSIEFITTEQNGLLMYNGPTIDNSEPQDFLSLSLVNGYPELKIDHGSGVETLYINSPMLNGGAKLNDGKWHHIRINRKSKLITMTVDYCKDIKPTTDSIVDDRSACEMSKSTPGDNKFLNVNGPLQLGGRYTTPNLPAGISTNKFNGCVRNLRHNKELYDLYTGSGTYPGSYDGCPKEDDACNSNSINQPRKCGDNGDCQLTNAITGETVCVCHSGWRGDRCEIRTSVRDLKGTGSYMDWSLTAAIQALLNQWDTDVHVMYRTRDDNGVIFHVSSTVSDEFIRLEIVSGHLQVLYNLGDGNHVVSLDRVPASDGQWHTVKIKRRGKFMALSMDHGEGSHHSEFHGPDFGHHLFEVRSNRIYSGAALDYTHTTPDVIDKDLKSVCLNDIRLHNKWFPVTMTESSQNTFVKLGQSVSTFENCVRDDCANAVCPSPFVCRPLWEAYDCVCPLHHIKVGSSQCVPIDYCSQLTPCHPDATCVNDVNNEYGYRCDCHPGWTGRTCYTAPLVETASANLYAEIWAPIIALLLIVLVIAFLFWKCRQTDEGLIDEDEKEDYEVRENVMDYDEEGAGEDDYEGHIAGLGRLPDPSRMDKPVHVDHLNRGAPPGGPGIGDFIGDRLQDAEEDGGAPPYDTMKTFDYEGEGSEAGSLSSLGTSTSGGDQDYDYLNEWGPKFAKLADMYNKYEDSD